MKKKQQQQKQKQGTGDEKEQELEIIKAVAQAWYGKSSSSRVSSTTEFDALRRNFKNKPSRFKLEAMKKASSFSPSNDELHGSSSTTCWDFGESLWDSYEIVTISKRLERGLVLDHTFSAEDYEGGNGLKKRKESKNSLRNILNRLSSRRFNEPVVPNEEGNESIR